MASAADPAREALARRVRAVLEGTEGVRERPMFGTRAFLVDDRLVLCARRGGHLLVRTDPGRGAELLSRPGAGRAAMRPDRPMGPGWIDVDADALDDEALRSWVDAALRHP